MIPIIPLEIVYTLIRVENSAGESQNDFIKVGPKGMSTTKSH